MDISSVSNRNCSSFCNFFKEPKVLIGTQKAQGCMKDIMGILLAKDIAVGLSPMSQALSVSWPKIWGTSPNTP